MADNESRAGPVEVIEYRIDRQDRIIHLGPAWERFARANQGDQVVPAVVLGRSLWEFVCDQTTLELYRRIVRQVRAGRPAEFKYRCDAPGRRRRYHMTVRQSGESEVEFLSTLEWEEARPAVALLEPGQERDGSFVRVCSWCEQVAMPDGRWVPVEDAVQILGLLDRARQPRLTHGICPNCYQGMMGVGP